MGNHYKEQETLALVDTVLRIKDSDDLQEAKRVFPLDAKTAKAALLTFGKQSFLDMGFNLSRVDAELGPNWINEALQESANAR